MKLVTYKNTSGTHLGLLIGHEVYNLHHLNPLIPDSMTEFLQGEKVMMDLARDIERQIINRSLLATKEKTYSLIAPVPKPTSCRDGYAFRQHVESARRNRGLSMIPEFDEFPIFYFTNHQSIRGEGEIYCMPDHFEKLDFELEVAIVIGKKGRNILAEDADGFIAGYMIMNDMSARTLQMEEMRLSLGPAKGKDFCTVIGPWLVTPDELEGFLVPPKAGHTGRSYDLEMRCKVNGTEVSYGNMKDMDWTFAEIIERCSYGVDLYPGDVIGSGTMGTGCFLELNGTGLSQNPFFVPTWLRQGDVVEMEITGLGKLTNTICAEESGHSILKLKKR